MNQTDAVASCYWNEFKKVVASRRSVRVYTPEPVPDEVVMEVLRLGLLAPNSSNLQPWEFIWVKSPEKLKRLQAYCLNQPAAKTSSTLIVCVARPDRWTLGQKLNLDFFAKQSNVPKGVYTYYKKLVPFMYNNGPLGVLGPFKSMLAFLLGLFRVMPRGPFGNSGNRLWATKTTALACENIMLGFRAAGFDSCPMEGFDEARVKSLLDLPRQASIVMVISAGKRAPQGVYGEQFRGDEELFIRKV